MDLFARRHEYDRVLIETSGLSDPVPILQSMITDHDVSITHQIPFVVTLVDTVHAEVTDYDPATQGETYPPGTKITFEFPARKGRGPLKLVWHDGNTAIPRPANFSPAAVRRTPLYGS